MIRPILLLSVTPFLTACGLEEIFNPGSSQRAAEYRASITAPPVPVVVEVAADPVVVPVVEPIAVTAEPEPVYVPPPAPEPARPTCQPVYRIVACGPNGETILL